MTSATQKKGPRKKRLTFIEPGRVAPSLLPAAGERGESDLDGTPALARGVPPSGLVADVPTPLQRPAGARSFPLRRPGAGQLP